MDMENKKEISKETNFFCVSEHNLVRIITFQKKCVANRKLEATITILFNLVLILHTLLAYFLLADSPLSQSLTSVLQKIQKQKNFLTISSVFLYSFSLFLMLLLHFAGGEQSRGISAEFTKFFMANFYWLVQLNLFLTGLMLYVDFTLNIAPMLLASLIFLFKTAVLGNFVSKREQNFQSSFALSSLFNLGLVLSQIINSLCVYCGNLNGFHAWSILSGLFLLFWFLKGGYKLFNHPVTSLILKIFLSLSLAINVEFLVCRVKVMNFSLLEASAAFLIIFGFLQVYSNSQNLDLKQLSYYENSGKIEELQYVLSLILQQADSNSCYLSLLIGLISQHSYSCSNPKCQLQRKSLQVFRSQFINKKDDYSKYFLRCLYEKALKRHNSKEVMMHYCQFMTSQFGELSSHLIYLNQMLTSHNLSQVERLKVIQMKLILREKSQSANMTALQGRIELSQIINFQEDFDFVVSNVGVFCERKKQIWSKIAQKTIDKLEIKRNFSQNVKILKQVNERWKRLSVALPFKKEWKYYYLLYFLYLKNEKVKVKHTKFQDQFLNEKQNPYQNNSYTQSVNSSIIFDSQSATMVTVLRNEQLVFQKASKHFTKLTLYSQTEIKDSPLNLILPLQLEHIHNKKVIESLHKGNLANEYKYAVKITHFRNKENREFPCITFFKLYIDLQNAKECCKFVALIRLNMKRINTELSKYEQQSVINKKRSARQQEQERGTITLDNTRNFFLKEEILHPVQEKKQLIQISLVLRGFSFFIVVLFIVFCFYTNSKASEQEKLVNTWNTLLGLYRYPISLMINYYRKSLNIGNQQSIKSSIKQTTQLFMQYEKDKPTNQLIFDKSLNSAIKYSPYLANQVNEGISYDHIDIFYLVTSCILTLSNSQTIDRSSYQFMQLNSYLLPAYDQVLNSTKMFAHYSLTGQLNKVNLNQLMFSTSFGIIFLIAALLYFYILTQYIKNTDRTVKIIQNFHSSYAQKLCNYWKQVQWGFKMFHQRFQQTYQQLSNSKQKKDSPLLQTQAKNQNKRALPQKQNDLKLLRFIVIGIMLLEFTACITLVGVDWNLFHKMKAFETAGFNLFKYYPSGTILGVALVQKYENLLNPKQQTFSYERYQNGIFNAKMIGSKDYVSDQDSSSLYFIKTKNYMFGNPCTSNPSLLNSDKINASFCTTFSNGILSQGVFAYYRYIAPKIQDYLLGKASFSISEINDILTGFIVSGYYIDDVILTFTEEFYSRLSSINSLNLTSLAVLGILVVLIHVIAFEYWLQGRLEQDYELISNIYNYLVPEYILIAQKLVKHEFYECGILKTP